MSIRPAARLLSLIALAGCAETAAPLGPPPAPPSLLDEDDTWAMVPAEADLVLWANLARVRESPWTRESLMRLSQETSVDDPGFDQVADVDRLLYAKVPALADSATILIVQGRFDRDRLGKAFERKGGPVQRSSYRTADLLVRGEEALAMIGRRTVLSGMTVVVRAAIDCNVGTARNIESEAWLAGLRKDLSKDKGIVPAVALYVHLQPATRETLLREMGEGGTLEDFGAHVDLDHDLDVTGVGMVPSPQEALDLAARLSDRIRELRNRPIIAAFGLGTVLDSLRVAAKDTRVRAAVHVSQRDRAEILERMAVVADMLAKMRKDKDPAAGKEKQ